jgi:hypothetical protein
VVAVAEEVAGMKSSSVLLEREGAVRKDGSP